MIITRESAWVAYRVLDQHVMCDLSDDRSFSASAEFKQPELTGPNWTSPSKAAVRTARLRYNNSTNKALPYPPSS
jgi:hypothetical protein